MFNMFTEANPDKGTETMRSLHFSNLCLRLQKLTPIRGRKPALITAIPTPAYTKFTEVNPDKGTETLFFSWSH